MPKTKKASYKKRNKNVKERMQSLRLQNSDKSNISAEPKLVQNNGYQSTRDQDVEFVAATNSDTFHFFPVNHTWSETMFQNLCTLISLHYSPYISATTISKPQIGSINAKPSVLKNIKGDGNCFFRCLSYLVTNTEENHLALRHLIVQSIQQRHLRSRSQTVQQYIQVSKMDFPDIWSTEVEIMTAASLLQTDIYTFALHGNLWKWLRYPAAGNFDAPVDIAKRAIYLVNTGSIHYDVVLDISEGTSSSVETRYHLPTFKTSEQLIKEEIHRQNLWQKQKLEQKAGNTPRTTTSSSTMRMRKLRAQNKDYREMEKLKACQRQREKRSDETFRNIEQKTNMKRMKTIRSNVEYSRKERQANLKRMKTNRSNEEYRKKESQANLNRMKTVRSNEEYKKRESQANLNRVKTIRTNEEYKEKESQANLNRIKTIRTNEEYKKKESQANLNRIKTIRTNEEYKKKESQANLNRMKTIRTNEEYKKKESQANLNRMKIVRSNEEYKRKESELNLNRVKTIRCNEEYKKKESQANLSRMKAIRCNDNYKKKETWANLSRMKTMRSNEEYRKNENQANLKRMKNVRRDEDYKKKENLSLSKRITAIRSNKEYRQRELVINHKRIRTLRSNENFSLSQRRLNKERMQSLRANASYSEQETQKNLERIQKLRKDHSFTLRERQQNLKRIRTLRNSKYGLAYQQRNKMRMQVLRKNLLFKAKEKKKNNKRMQKLRKNVQYVQAESSEKCKKRATHNTKSFRDLQHKFWQSVSVGPEYVCCSCHQLWYKDSVISAKLLQQKLSKSKSWLSKENDPWICRTCHLYVTSGKTPPLGRDNNMTLLEVPDELNLHSLEERLVSLRTPFMQIRELPRGRQLSLKGNVVNVPADVSTTVKTLPRRIDETQTIPVKFKRKLSFKHSVQSQNVRPSKVVDAAAWLVNNSQLYRDEGVTIEKSWRENLKNVEHDWKEFLDPVEKETTQTSTLNTSEGDAQLQAEDHSEMTPDSDDEWTEIQNEDANPAGSLDTMLAPQFDNDSSFAFCFAPSEGNVPLGLFQDLHAEELAFPTLFCGQPRSRTNFRVHYSSICKWELRHKDRRFAKSVANIFYKAKKLQISQIQQKATLSLRKKKTGGKKLTAEIFKNMESVQEMLSLDEGFRVFRTVRGSPPYWEKTKKELFAMIRQLGIPTWFMSFSAAETRWLHLLRILGRTVHNKEYSDAEILNMTWHEKSELIQSDPVTCARHFDYMIRRFINDVLLSSYHPVGQIVDHFYRVEFQQRGSPHIHMLAWVSNAPVYENASNTEVASFIDKYITCKKPSSEHLPLNLQTHSHAKTCRKKREGVCRFGFPIPPMPRTMILTPLENVTSDEKDQFSALYDKVKAYLNDLKFADDVTTSFQEMLDILETTEEQYIQAIRSSLTSDKIFLQRSPNEIRINAYSRVLLETWKANMDIQYILDPYACAMYIVSYISKGQRGMSNLMQRATKEAREGNLDIKQRVRHIGNKFLNHVEISAQEAVYLVLQMSLRKASRQFVFINTSPPEDRTILLKPLDYIQQLPDGSTDIECMGLIKKYAARPKVLDTYCLADFAAWFDVSTNKKKNESAMQDGNESGDDNEDELDIQEQDDSTTCYTVGALQFKKRRKAKVVRYVRFNKQNDLENYCREQLMLFHPWRNEMDLKGTFETFQEQYKLLETSLKEKEADYNHNSEAVDQAIESLDAEDYDFISGDIAPNTEHKEQLDRKQIEMADKKRSSESHELYDIGQDMGIAVNNANIEELQKPRLPETQYHELVNNLNVKQKGFFYHVLHWCKTKNQPFYNFLTGGAGVGKSQVVKALYNALLRYYSTVPGNNPDDTHILLMALTGKAAYGIGGYTIHNALQIPANQGYDYKALTAERLNTLQAKYHSLKVIFIDEISMVGNKMLRFIDQRLQQIMGTKKVFGGVSIIAVGDLFQLKPVRDGWIFNDLNTDYGPLATNLWKSLFTAFELTEIMRQKDDQKFAELLNRLREGKQTQEDLALLKTREVPPESIPSYATHLFQTNAKVNAHNEQMFSLLDITKVEVPSLDIVTGDVTNTVKEKMISLIPHDPNKTMGLMGKLSLGIAQRVDLCINVAVDDELINGASGIVKYVDSAQGQQVDIVWVQFDDPKIGKIVRDTRKELFHPQICPMWTPVTRVARQFRIGRYKNAEILRKQFPLRPAAAKTVHRCQGDTLKEVAIDMSGRAVQCHIHYVALSRVTSMTGLYIYDLNHGKINVDIRVAKEMEELRTVRCMKMCVPCLPNIDGSTTIIQQNVRSLRKHLTDIKSDSAMLSADVLLFTECHLFENITDEEVNIEGYKVFLNFPSHASSVHSPYGTAIYTRDGIVIRQQESCTFNNVEISHVTIDTMTGTLQIIVIYRSKTVPLQHLENALKHLFTLVDPSQPTVLTGDFNVDILKDTPDKFKLQSLLVDSLNYRQIIHSATTDYNSCLDHIYTNIPPTKLQGGTVLESFYTDHKAVWVSVK
ncbi:ATP-dependent DNA helicase pfh1 [Holothuria leucospilota]|uniref:ATP-dependent DNA helicase n=1 Tax=Holothuria leucospilota TaxID=206669 RepID=A0A9Q1CQ87_HOLLE|nr:ATP-dependent DNA helicase pfh1 [Holothuria leucospilota]